MARYNTVLLASASNPSFTGQALFADGSLSLPSISFTSDPDTGFYWASANNISWSAGGAAQGRLAVNGMVFNQSVAICWTNSSDPLGTRDSQIARVGTSIIGFGNLSQTYDNECAIGDATHRLTNLSTKQITIGQSLANPTMGVVTLSGSGVAIAYTSAFTSGARVFLTHQNAAGTTGTARVTASTAGVGFTITSSSATDTSTIGWWVVPVS